MALTVENRDSNFESHSDEQRDLETTIDSLGLPAEQAESLKNSLQTSEATEEQIQAFLDDFAKQVDKDGKESIEEFRKLLS